MLDISLLAAPNDFSQTGMNELLCKLVSIDCDIHTVMPRENKVRFLMIDTKRELKMGPETKGNKKAGHGVMNNHGRLPP